MDTSLVRRAFNVLLVGVFLAAAGCVQAPSEININVDAGGIGEPSDKEPSDDESSGGGSSSGSWTDVLSNIGGQILAAEHGVLFYAFDTLAYPQKPVDLVARLQSGKSIKAIDGALLGFYRGDELEGTARTDEDGYGRISWTPPAGGDHEFTVRIIEAPTDKDDYADAVNVTPAPLLVAAREKYVDLTIVDLDHTVVDAGFSRVLIGGAKPMPGSIDVMGKLAKRYTIVYLTHRPDILTRKSKAWLKDNGYPRGPLLVSELKEAFGDSGTFKTAKLKAIRSSFPNVRIGIGDKLSDAQAYVDNGLTAYLIPDYKNKPKSMRKMADQIRQLKGNGRLHVVSGWQEIDAGIFSGRTFPPEAFAKRLDEQAKQLEEAKKRQEEEEDD